MRVLLALVLLIACSRPAESPDLDDTLYDHGGPHVTGDGYDLYCGKGYALVYDQENHPFCQDQ